MKKDQLSSPENLEKLKNEIFNFTKDLSFKRSESMGDLMEATFDFVVRNYKNVSLSKLF